MITDGHKRRKKILAYLSTQTTPVNGTRLAQLFGVSRQIIVQDVALLRADNQTILSTNKGYLLYRSHEAVNSCTAVIAVVHTAEETLEEMRCITEYGGRMLDIFIEHDLYGQIRADLIINDMSDAEEFCRKMRHSSSKPLKELTEGHHYHTIAAPSEKLLQLIRNELAEKGFLLPDNFAG